MRHAGSRGQVPWRRRQRGRIASASAAREASSRLTARCWWQRAHALRPIFRASQVVTPGERTPIPRSHHQRSRASSRAARDCSGNASRCRRKDFAAAAASADVVVAAVGLTSDLEGEEMKIDMEGFSGGDKTSLDLPADQRKLLEQVKATGKPLVVVALNGSTIDLSWAKENAAAIIEAWYPGQAGGLAVANVISGKVNPAGRLPLTFYRNVADLPPFSDYSMKNRTYRYFTGTPVYPFGYGLSYTTFEYGPLKFEPVDGDLEHGARVTTVVTNTGKRAGEEVAQLYLEPPRYEARRDWHCADSSASSCSPANARRLR